MCLVIQAQILPHLQERGSYVDLKLATSTYRQSPHSQQGTQGEGSITNNLVECQ